MNRPSSTRCTRHRAHRIITQRLLGRIHNKSKYAHKTAFIQHHLPNVNLPLQFNIAAMCVMISPEDPRLYVEALIAGTEMTFKCLLDIGSTSSIMTLVQYKELGQRQPFYARPQRIVTASDKSGLSILGEARIALTIGNHTKEVHFHIADNCTQGCILGQDVINDFDLYVYKGRYMTRSELKTYVKDTDKGVLAARRDITLQLGEFQEAPAKAYGNKADTDPKYSSIQHNKQTIRRIRTRLPSSIRNGR